MAVAAIVPRATSTLFETGLLPFGVRDGRRLNATAVMNNGTNPTSARARSLRFGDNRPPTSVRTIAPSNPQIANDPSDVHRSGRDAWLNHLGRTSHAPRNSAFRSMPSGTIAMLANNASSPPAR